MLTLIKTSGTQTPETHFGEGIIRGTQVMYYEKDHLGSIRTVLNTAGTVLERNDYYPFGMRHANASHVVTANNRYKFNGKEDQTVGALGLLDYGARMYDAQIGRWLTVDPLAEKYPSISSYAYVVNNPISFIDPDGRVVIAADINARRNIINTLSREEEQYVKFNDNGMLDVSLLNQYTGSSDNFIALRKLANSETNYIFAVADQDINGSKFFDIGADPTNPNNFSYGVTNMPGMENDPSPDNNVYIFTASFLSGKKQASNTAHEGYGHAYFYELSKSDPSLNPNHTKGIVGTGSEYDPELKMYIPYFIFGNTNTKLEDQIKKVEQQAIKNYEDRYP